MNDFIKAFAKAVLVYVTILFITNFMNFLFLKGYAFSYNRKYVDSNWKQASKAFKINIKKLKKMSKDEIKKAYRDRAKKVHPDHGGNKEDFNNLHEAYKFVYAS